MADGHIPVITEEDLAIQEKNYRRTRVVLDFLRRFLKVNIKVHNETGQFEKGDIFLFNHFARFETFIPQYLIFEKTGKTSRSLAAPELFRDEGFGRYLLSIGAVPTNLPEVIHFMACEINRGRKSIIFPEGAMIKDRRVLGPRGRLRIYSRDTRTYRKPHTGAAVIALYAQRMRELFVLAFERKKEKILQDMTAVFGTEDREEAVARASEPVRLVPANITFYPLRGDDNFLRKVAGRLGKITSERLAEELIIEGNILLKDTDMDIRLAEAIPVTNYYSPMDRTFLNSRFFVEKRKVFKKTYERLLSKLENVRTEILSERIMVHYMKSIYAMVTINMGHLSAEVIYELLRRYKQREVSSHFFDQVIYFCIKKLQHGPSIFLHRSLLDPDRYSALLSHNSRDLLDIVLQAEAAGLMRSQNGTYIFLPALEKSYHFDEIRIRNFLKVRHNENRTIPIIEENVRSVLTNFDHLDTPLSWAAMLYDDDVRSYQRDLNVYCHAKYEEINREETLVESGAPFFLSPVDPTVPHIGVLLIHGFTASPAEMKPLGEFLAEEGCCVYGPRLKGHGTSPCDLDRRTFHDWYRSLSRGLEVLKRSCEKLFVVGFSMGGCLGLLLAEEMGTEINGVVSVSAPLRIRNKNIMFANLMNQINRLAASLPYLDGIKRYKRARPENPRINYQNIPISALKEFKDLMEKTEDRLGEIYAPALIIQGRQDPTVDPVSADLILKGLASPEKKLIMLDTDRHVILEEKGSQIHQEIRAFIHGL
ncbi:MAG: alpha/beta fold hydrolase [bacterium]|nr:alpha/beta fold hydrolase [bacterium]